MDLNLEVHDHGTQSRTMKTSVRSVTITADMKEFLDVMERFRSSDSDCQETAKSTEL
jgi:hypothetical protein